MSKGSVELVGVSKRYDESLAVKEINLKIPGGSYCCLLGRWFHFPWSSEMFD